VWSRSRRLESRFSAAAPGRRFGGNEAAHGASQIPLHKHFTRLRRPPSRQEDGCTAGPLTHVLSVFLEVASHKVVHRETPLGQRDGVRHDVRQAHRAELLQRRDPGIGGRGRDTTLHTGGNATAMMLLEVLHTRRLRPTPQAANGHHPVLFCQIENDGRHPRQIDHIDLQHARAESCRHPRINGISTPIQDTLCGQRRQVMA